MFVHILIQMKYEEMDILYYLFLLQEEDQSK